jgi:hypothetical protein
MKNKGKNQHRFKQNPLEKEFAEAWEEINNREGSNILDYLMANKTNSPCSEVSDKDRMVAATVVQWLGSPVGQSFLIQIQGNLK